MQLLYTNNRLKTILVQNKSFLRRRVIKIYKDKSFSKSTMLKNKLCSMKYILIAPLHISNILTSSQKTRIIHKTLTLLRAIK